MAVTTFSKPAYQGFVPLKTGDNNLRRKNLLMYKRALKIASLISAKIIPLS
jgi:hypothetical protein